MLEVLASRQDGLPEEHIRRNLESARSIDDQQATRAQTPQPRRSATLRMQPRGRIYDVVDPVRPRRVAELSFTVAATGKIDLQHPPSGPGKRTRLFCCHAARLVHLFAERMHVEHAAD